ncbi:MAG: hypothetical protein LBV67_07745 [Streptococcaceae bacterium]|jgi:hypothetical protein|nr:hypothetical protein [Streptococcaceae bacterium]
MWCKKCKAIIWNKEKGCCLCTQRINKGKKPLYFKTQMTYFLAFFGATVLIFLAIYPFLEGLSNTAASEPRTTYQATPKLPKTNSERQTTTQSEVSSPHTEHNDSKLLDYQEEQLLAGVPIFLIPDIPMLHERCSVEGCVDGQIMCVLCDGTGQVTSPTPGPDWSCNTRGYTNCICDSGFLPWKTTQEFRSYVYMLWDIYYSTGATVFNVETYDSDPYLIIMPCVYCNGDPASLAGDVFCLSCNWGLWLFTSTDANAQITSDDFPEQRINSDSLNAAKAQSWRSYFSDSKQRWQTYRIGVEHGNKCTGCGTSTTGVRCVNCTQKKINQYDGLVWNP